MSCGNCHAPLTHTEVSYGTGMCNKCYDLATGLTQACSLCSAVLSPVERGYAKGVCNTCYDLKRRAVPCMGCKAHLSVKEQSYGTGVCDKCFDTKALEKPLAPNCSKCGDPFAANEKHAVRGLCSKCRAAALQTVLPKAPTAAIPLDALVFYLETGVMPSNYRVSSNIYGRFQAYPDNWNTTSVAKYCILPVDRPTTFVLGPDGIEALIGKQGFDMLMAVGLTKEHVTRVIQRKKKYGLVLFEGQDSTHLSPIPADWDGVEAVIKTHYPIVWDVIKASLPLMKRLTLKQIVASGKDTTSTWLKAGLSPTAAYLKSSQTLCDARLWLANELFCCEPYSGNGWTYSDEGERGVREYFVPNVQLSTLKSWRFIDIPVALTEKALPLPAEWCPQTTNLYLQDLTPGAEYNGIVARLRATLPRANVKSIKRVQNKLLYQKYAHERKHLTEWHGAPPKELHLFHGTSGASPDLVYNSETGFDMRFCTSGMWGVATYFAVNASYSEGYAYCKHGPAIPGAQKQMFFASVLVGDAHLCPSDGGLRMPPIKANTPAKGAVRYDSVQGNTGGSDVYMIYCNGRAYPSYLITFT